MSDTAVSDGFRVSSSSETPAEILSNLESEPKPLDGDPEQDEKRDVSKAAAALGKKGGEAAAKARAKAKEDEDEPEKDAKPAPKTPSKVQDETDDEDEGEDKGEDKGKAGNPRHDLKARLAQVAEQKRMAQARADALEARLAAVEAERRVPANPEKQEAAPAGDGKPQVENYATYEEFAEALMEWKMDHRIKTLSEQTEQQRREQDIHMAQREREAAFLERIGKAKEADPEILDRVDPDLMGLLRPTPPGQPPTASSTIADEVMASEDGPRLLVYFTEHPEVVRELAAMSNAREIARRVAKIETQLDAGQPAPAPTPAKAHVSQAKPPIRPISATAHIPEEPDPADLPFDQFVKAENERERRLRRGR